MNEKVLIAIKDDFTRKLYSRVFTDEKFEVLEAENGEKSLALAKKETPDIILVDVLLSKIGCFDLMKALKKEPATRKIPIMVFAQVGREEDRLRAIELEAKDFIVGVLTSPPDVVLRAKMHLGEQKIYRLPVLKDVSGTKELAKDLGYVAGLTCSRCGSPLVLSLIRDLSRGKNYFKVSFICSKCD